MENKDISKVIEHLKQIAKEHGTMDFSINDNCPCDGWRGCLYEEGVNMFANDHSEGEFFDFDSDEVRNWAEEIETACQYVLDKEEYLTTYPRIQMELNHTLEEWNKAFGEDESLWDFPLDEITDGTIEVNQSIVYWLIDGRVYETNVTLYEK